MELNKVLLIGNLTRDPESRTTGNGTALCKFDLAVNTRRGKDKDEVLFIRVECWQKTAELAGQYLKKGTSCLVEVRLKSEEYETKDGQKRKDMVIVADNLRFGPRPNNETGYGNPSGQRTAPASAPRQAEPETKWESRKATAAPETEDKGGTEDDLPF